MSDNEKDKLFSFLESTEITFIAGTTRTSIKRENMQFREVVL